MSIYETSTMCQAILHNFFDPFICRAVGDVLISVLRLRKLRLRQALTIGMHISGLVLALSSMP